MSLPEARYLVFHRSGPLPQVVVDCWQDVWAYFAGKNTPARAYSFDFEIYPNATHIEIWVAARDAQS